MSMNHLRPLASGACGAALTSLHTSPGQAVYSPAVKECAPDDLSLPEALAEVFSIGFDWEWDEATETARGCDFEPHEAFESPARTARFPHRPPQLRRPDSCWTTATMSLSLAAH